jgi:prefoldin subunit 5
MGLPTLPAPTSDLAARLAAADAAISTIQELLVEVRTSQNELRRTLNDLKRDRDAWRGRLATE